MTMEHSVKCIKVIKFDRTWWCDGRRLGNDRLSPDFWWALYILFKELIKNGSFNYPINASYSILRYLGLIF